MWRTCPSHHHKSHDIRRPSASVGWLVMSPSAGTGALFQIPVATSFFNDIADTSLIYPEWSAWFNVIHSNLIVQDVITRCRIKSKILVVWSYSICSIRWLAFLLWSAQAASPCLGLSLELRSLQPHPPCMYTPLRVWFWRSTLTVVGCPDLLILLFL